MGDDVADRDAILARRAILLSTALAALSCSGEPGPGTPTSSGVVPVETAPTTSSSASVSASATASSRGALPPALAPWKEVLAAAPPRGASKQSSAAEKALFDNQEKIFDSEYEKLQALWDAMPGCDAALPDCRATWRTVGAKLKAYYDATRGGIGGCGFVAGQTGTIIGRTQAHRAYQKELVGRIEAQLDAIAAAFSPQGEQEWRKVLANAKEIPPMPCLSPCPMPEVVGITQVVPFAKDSAELSDPVAKATLEQIAAMHKGNRKPSIIVVRGHASAGEAKPAEISMARAKAVAAALVKAGVPKEAVEVKGLGAELLVDRDDKEATAAKNRRVDFEAVPKP